MSNSRFIRGTIRWHSTSFLLAGILAGSPIFSAQAGSNPSFDRSRLPIADPVYPNETEIDPNKAQMPLQPEVVAPSGAEPVCNHESKAFRWIISSELFNVNAESGLCRLVDRGLTLVSRLQNDGVI